MALRNIVLEDEPVLRKKSRLVTDFNPRLHQLLDDMKETLLNANGVGLAAVQVGVLRRAVLVMETNVEEEYVIELINPEIIDSDGSECAPEGCLSIPGEFGLVERPTWVKVRAQDRNGSFFEVEGEDLTARAMCHEIDHLDGKIFVDLAEKMLTDEDLEAYRKEKEDEQ